MTETTTYHANEIATASGMREHSARKREIAATATACQGIRRVAAAQFNCRWHNGGLPRTEMQKRAKFGEEYRARGQERVTRRRRTGSCRGDDGGAVVVVDAKKLTATVKHPSSGSCLQQARTLRQATRSESKNHVPHISQVAPLCV